MRLGAAVNVLRTAGVSMVAGVVFAATGFGLVMCAVVLLLARSMPPWAAALTVGGALLVVGVGLAAVAVRSGARDVSTALTTNPVEMQPYD